MTAETVGGRYRFERVLGHGGMATVHLARDEELDRMVAVKCLSEALSDDEIFRERFTREARMAAQLSHPNIVGIFDVGEDGGVPYLVMEYVESETLAELMARKGPIDPDRAVDLVLQVCAGLAEAHGAGLVHRDIKPQNLLVRPDDTVKIADFGIARPVDATQLTLAGTILGTAAYLAPEQALGERVTGAADIYSLGAVTYELLSGHPPYTFDSIADLTVKQREGPPPPIPGVSAELQEVVVRCLAADPEARPRSAAALAHELAQASPDTPTEAFQASETTAATQVMTPPRWTVRVSRRTQIAAAAALGVAALAGGLVFGLTLGGDGTASPPAQSVPIGVIPRGDTPAESARILADWLRARAD
jgi:eukaryotic-like serine/threonine-protein kinase